MSHCARKRLRDEPADDPAFRPMDSFKRPQKLRDAEAVFQENMAMSFVARGQLLQAIRHDFEEWQQRASLSSRMTWPTYLRRQFRTTKRHTDRLIAASSAYSKLQAVHQQSGQLVPMPMSESVIRVVLSHARSGDATDIAEAWQLVVNSIDRSNSRGISAEDAKLALEQRARVFQSRNNERWYTPTALLDRCRRVFGSGIGTDPASDEFGQSRVQAQTFFDKSEDGRLQRWSGPVFVNTPSDSSYGSTSEHAVWMNLFLSKHQAGEFAEGIALTYAASNRLWFQKLLRQPLLTCCLLTAVRFDRDDGSSTQNAPHPIAAFYVGPNRERFIAEFDAIGTVVAAVQSDSLQ